MHNEIFQILEDMSDCCGCFACLNACPVGAIRKEPNTKGFLYPQIDHTKCINCKKCVKSCPIVNYKQPK